MMAQETSEASVASTSSSGPNWWEGQIKGVSSAASWSHHHLHHPWQSRNPNSNSPCEEEISISSTSFANASNHSGLSADSAADTDLAGEHVENHLWSQVLLGVGSVGDLRSTHNDGENFLEVLSSENLTMEIPEPACNYLKKLDSNSWDFANPTSFHHLEKQMNAYHGSFIEHERLNNLPDLVNNWSIAPPAPQVTSRQINPPNTCSTPLSTPTARYLEPSFSHVKNEVPTSSAYPGDGAAAGDRSAGILTGYRHQMKRERHHLDLGASETSLQSPISHTGGYHTGLSNPHRGVNKYYNGITDAPLSATRSFSDLVTFRGCLNKPLIDFRGSKSGVKSSDSADCRKLKGHETAPSVRGSGSHPSVTSEGKKKRSEDNTETHMKKSKNENLTTPSVKLQAPKVKLGERITKLQQIVSPFGKTDTASVLIETISYIRFLHEQVQLLSDPYMKSGVNKDHSSWGGLEGKDKQEPKAGLKSRGLCLVPVSCTPQVYRENNGPDYWTPTYRGCLYR